METALASAYSGEYSLIRSVLFDYPLGTQPPPPTPSNCPSTVSAVLTRPLNQLPSLPIPRPTAPLYYTGAIINVGGLESTIDAADPFVMQYADGLEVGWGRLTLDQVSQQTRIVSLQFNIEMRSPYLRPGAELQRRLTRTPHDAASCKWR